MKILHHGVWFRLLCVIGLLFLLPSPAEAAPPDSCLAYAFTESQNHQFLVGDNTSQFGTNMTIIHDCDEIMVIIDESEFTSSRNFTLVLDQGLHNISLIGDNFTAHYDNVNFYPDRLDWEGQYRFLIDADVEYIDVGIAEVRANWAVVWGVIIVWALSTMVYWNLISSYTQRNFIEEVKQ
jgi:hypothetical protein